MRSLPLRVNRLRFRFKAAQGLTLGAFNAATWRGALGHALRRAACVTGQSECGGCLLRHGCAYSYLFESPPADRTDRMRRYPSVQGPMVIRNSLGSGEWPEGTIVDLEIMLFGEKATEYLPFLIHALEQAGRNGLGWKRQPLVLDAVDARHGQDGWCSVWRPGSPLEPLPNSPLPPLPPLPGETLVIELQTPLRLVQDGVTLHADQMRPAHLWRTLTRRLSMICYFHGGVDLKLDFAALHRRAEQLEWLNPVFQNKTWKRHSSRQRRKILMPGIVGRAGLDLSGAEELWPWLWWGQWLHAGKGTVMGLGQYRLEKSKLSGSATNGQILHHGHVRVREGSKGTAAGQGFREERTGFKSPPDENMKQ